MFDTMKHIFRKGENVVVGNGNNNSTPHIENPIVAKYMGYDNGLTALLSKAIIDCGGTVNAEKWNLLFSAMHQLFQLKVKQYHSLDSGSMMEFIVNDDRFIPAAGNPRQYMIADGSDNWVGTIWYKNMLGGWRLSFTNDNIIEDWKSRGVIDSKEKFEKYFKKRVSK